MKNSVKNVIVLVICVSLCSFVCPTTEISLRGHLRSKGHKQVTGYTIFVTGVGISMWMGAVTTDKNGDFTLEFNAGSAPDPISFYCVNKHNDTIFLKRTKHLVSDTPDMTFWIK